MIVVVVSCVAGALGLGLGLALIRTRRRASDLQIALDAVSNERDAVQAEADAADDRAAAALRERDDAYERVQRARRDAADVAGRLRDESAARAEAEVAGAAAVSRGDVLERELADARAVIDAQGVELVGLRAKLVAEDRAPSASGPDNVGLLWDLALARAERTWRTSISLSVDEDSPFAGSNDALRTAVEIEIDAAREEAGADIDLHWSGDAVAPPSAAVVVYSLVESVIASVAKSARTSVVHVTVAEDEIQLRFEVVDETGRPLEIMLPASVSSAPGRARVPLDDTPRGAPLDR